MEKYIIELLNSNLRVIIPDFGAFIIRQKEPKIIVFNEFLRYNDGLLIEYICKQEGIEKTIAEERLSTYAEESEKILENKGEFVIKGLGKLLKDASGKINFIDETETIKEVRTPKKKSKDETASKELQVKEKTAKAIPEKKIPEKSKTSAGEKAQTEAKTAEPVTNEIKQDVKPEITVTPVVVNKPEEKIVLPKPKQEQPEIVKEKPAIPNAQTPKASPEVREEKSTPVYTSQSSGDSRTITARPVSQEKNLNVNRGNQILLWVILILLVNAAILAWFLYHDDIKNLFNGKNAKVLTSDSLSNKETDTNYTAPSEDTLVSAEKTIPSKESASVVPVTQPVQPRYYIVAGCFREEAHADAYVKSLKNKGYNAEKFGRIGNLYAVSFNSFQNKEDARKELQRIREQVQKEAWMTQY